ncbi:rhodanese-like domain-containing protein [Actinacidiphila guanduensis]|uniref:Rhodanese-related sulfurtransferase n=1 Tax=Actinacidiphila guanduensis TaxID=310781 RepID=A0A1H0N258_9ACTN|nr:rhodanese-like domain-containing protein [Actinacidiphila guanduensis]SDO86606.1 Rhodanese-related sulfurtransferase [Actinacidiphila guanduensis]
MTAPAAHPASAAAPLATSAGASAASSAGPSSGTSAPTAGAAAPAATAVLAVPAAEPAQAAAYFAASLAFHTDVSDVAAALAAGGDPGFTVVDSRSAAAYEQGHIPGALHLPTADIPRLAPQLLDPVRPLVVYCWGPGCNGAARAALALAGLGHRVKEMLGGMEYWIREGFGYDTADGPARRDPDPLTAPVEAPDCGC